MLKERKHNCCFHERTTTADFLHMPDSKNKKAVPKKYSEYPEISINTWHCDLATNNKMPNFFDSIQNKVEDQ